MRWISTLACMTWSLVCFVKADLPPSIAESLEAVNVSWDTPGGEMGSMPIGNGDVAGNVWVDTNGDLVFYIAKSDAWNEQGRLLKLGRVRVKFEPALPVTKFRQTLDLRHGEVVIEGGEGEASTKLRVWADANQPVIRVACESKIPRACTARGELWRTENKPYVVGTKEQTVPKEHSEAGLESSSEPLTALADTVMALAKTRIGWYHRNTSSIYESTLKSQHLGGLITKHPDPLMNRTFGVLASGLGMKAGEGLLLASDAPATSWTLSFTALTEVTPTAAEWEKKITALADRIDSRSTTKAKAAHDAWWSDFWNRSWIFIDGEEGAKVTRGFVLQRFMIAACSRGPMPPKFNGGLFTVQMPGTPDPDYRQWGSNYWFQNNRWLNWPFLATGDFDLMQPFFRMYRDILSLSKERTRIAFSHEGAYFPETMYFWGTYNANDFHVFGKGNGKWAGWNNPEPLACNPFVRSYWQSGLEVSAMMLDYYDHTRDAKFAKETLVPVADGVVTFYDQHWKRDESGKIRFEPSASLETWHKASNDLPTIAALRFLLPRMLALPKSLTTEKQRAAWSNTLADLPPVPVAERNGKKMLSPAESYSDKRNHENPELYAVFPYRLYGVGKPEIELARNAFDVRAHTNRYCWHQDGVQSALLGMADLAGSCALTNFTQSCAPQRFPAFWPKNFDWTPDLDNGGTAMMTVNYMLLQCEGQHITLLPAWPKKWNARFKVCAPGNTTLEGDVRDGKVTQLRVTPESRRKDVKICDAQ